MILALEKTQKTKLDILVNNDGLLAKKIAKRFKNSNFECVRRSSFPQELSGKIEECIVVLIKFFERQTFTSNNFLEFLNDFNGFSGVAERDTL